MGLNSPLFDKVRIKPRCDEPRRDAPTCERAGCKEAGPHRAPKGRGREGQYWQFCLSHVREYNAAWDFYKGMSAGEIEAHLRQDTAWQRPTWPLGRLGGASRLDAETLLRDPLGALHGTPLHEARRHRQEQRAAERRAAQGTAPPPELRAALDVLGLGWPLDAPALRARWKELAKQLHPDANGGDRSAEDRLKDVNRAYSLLRSRVSGAGGGAAGSSAGAAGAAPAAAQ
jgi:hypothetical protein